MAYVLVDRPSRRNSSVDLGLDRTRGYVPPVRRIRRTGSLGRGRGDAPHPPGLFDAAYLSHRYRSEFEIMEAPAPVRRFVFPVIVAVGRLLGRHRRFAEAPEPLRA